MIRLAAWICVATLAVLSLWPALTVIRMALGGHIEHVFAYAAAAVIVALSQRVWATPYRRRPAHDRSASKIFAGDAILS